MKRMNRWTAGILTAGMALSVLTATGAHASSEGRRNTAIAATAAAGYFAYKYAQKPSTKRIIPVAASAGAAVIAWNKYSSKRQDERAAQRNRDRAKWVAYGRRTANSKR